LETALEYAPMHTTGIYDDTVAGTGDGKMTVGRELPKEMAMERS
jgi:hypothetical protein